MPSPPMGGDAVLESVRIEVAVVPSGSPFANLVRDAARAAGAEFVRIELTSPGDVGPQRILVVDLTQAAEGGAKLGPRCIAISSRLDLDAYEVVPPDTARFQLKRVIRNIVERELLSARIQQEQEAVEILNQIGYALSAQTSQAALLDTVLTHARRVLKADGGSIYLVHADKLRFVCSQNDTIPFRPSRQELLRDDTSMAGFVANHGEVLNIADAYQIDPDAPYKPNFTFDQDTGYRTKSILLVPMLDRDGEVLGVLSLINRKKKSGIPLASFQLVGDFTAAHARVAVSIASQAAVAIENYRLYGEIRALFDGFVEAAVTAIEARDPTTGGHSHRVAMLTTALARAVHESREGEFDAIHFQERDLTELHYAAMLHDFGKVGVREQVLLKAEKLYTWEMDQVEARFRVAAMQTMLESIQNRITADDVGVVLADLKADLAVIRRFNRPGPRPSPDDVDQLNRISDRWRLTDLGEQVLKPREVRRLCIPRGSLDPEERREIEEHVTHTYSFLKVIPWTRDLKRVPDLAYAHHEKLDGTGYPRGLKDEEIPFGAKLMTIADIFDALTAGDRPYKAAMTTTVAVRILREEAADGKLHIPAVELFAARRLWDGIVPA